jgi:hypothetical protein
MVGVDGSVDVVNKGLLSLNSPNFELFHFGVISGSKQRSSIMSQNSLTHISNQRLRII